jgi:hypothetical protein
LARGELIPFPTLPGSPPQAHQAGGTALGRTKDDAGRNQPVIYLTLERARCYVVVSDVPQQQLSAQEVHDSCVSSQKVERDFRQPKTGLSVTYIENLLTGQGEDPP